MPNQIPFSGATGAAGGFVLPDRQGELLTNGLLQEGGAINLAGDRRATGSRKEVFPIWLGTPTAGVVGEGARKPVTGGELGQANLTAKKIASIVLFTDEQKADMINGDVDVLVDSGVRSAIADVIDVQATGNDSGTNITSSFDSMLRSTTTTVEYDATKADGLRLAVSAAWGTLEANGYGKASDVGVLLGGDVARHLRDARSSTDTTKPAYADTDPLYGLQREFSTNLNGITEVAGVGKIVGFVVHKPNIHVRIRKDVTLTASSEATINDGVSDRFLFQEDLTAVRYETRLGMLVHDLNRAVVAIVNAA